MMLQSMLGSLFLFFQLVEDAAGSAPLKERESLIDIILGSSTSGLIVMAILFFLSIGAVFIILERYMTLSKAEQVDQNFMNSIRASVESGNIQAAKALCQSVDAPMARMVEKGLDRIGKPLDDINKAIENIGNLELLKLEKNLSTLASISGIAPMIGLLGTVIGLIIAFQDMTGATNITPQTLSSGIYHALTATAAGLLVSIIAMFGYNVLVSKLDKVIFKMENTAVQFMDLLQEPTR
ncbi:MAG: MotA/TolQ/ExbB proton channel family protein [Chitinophagales bacterium]|jgi:biopolymer transport protein ExbB